ncbi:MAG: hypothetical protein EOM87_04415 [Clostridia bacterium]|nr:hypothetical protein [Clostridia bacterium]
MKKYFLIIFSVIIIAAFLPSCSNSSTDKAAMNLLDDALEKNSSANSYTVHYITDTVNKVSDKESAFTSDMTTKIEGLKNESIKMFINLEYKGNMYFGDILRDFNETSMSVYSDGFEYFLGTNGKRAMTDEEARKRAVNYSGMGFGEKACHYENVEKAENPDGGWIITCTGPNDNGRTEWLDSLCNIFKIDIIENDAKIESVKDIFRIGADGYVISVERKYLFSYVQNDEVVSYDVKSSLTFSDFDVTTVSVPENSAEYSRIDIYS